MSHISIKTVLAKTGIHRQTVHYYLRKQLLPPPLRTSRTSALYPASTIDLIVLIQTLQRQQRLSLDEIGDLFRRHNYDVRAIRHNAAQSAFAPLHVLLGEPLQSLIPLSDVADQLNPPPPREWLDQILSSHILRPVLRDNRHYLTPDSLEALRAAWNGVRAGASLEQLRTLGQSIERQATREFEQFLQSLDAVHSPRDAGTQVAKLFSSLERYGAMRRRDMLHSLFMERLKRPGNLFFGPNRTYVFPSRTFLQKMGLFRTLDLLLLQLDRDPNDLAALRNLARVSYLSSDWTRSHHAASEILRLHPNDPSATALYGQALTYLGRAKESITFLEEAISRAPNPMAKIRLGQALATQAYESADASLLLDAVVRRTRLANEAIRESAAHPGLHRKVRLNAMLDTIYFSDPLGLTRPVEKEAQALYEEFRTLPDKKLPPLGKVSLAMAKMYSAYALYLVLQQQSHTKAAPLLKEIARLDPDCVLASRRDASAPTRKPARR